MIEVISFNTPKLRLTDEEKKELYMAEGKINELCSSLNYLTNWNVARAIYSVTKTSSKLVKRHVLKDLLERRPSLHEVYKRNKRSDYTMNTEEDYK